MTLQYRTRDMSDDRSWQQRVRLSYRLLMDAVDSWYRGDDDFPFMFIVASILYLFSPRCDPFRTLETNLRQQLAKVVDSPSVECAKTWPHQSETHRSKLISSITDILRDAVDQWIRGSLASPSVGAVNEQLVEEVVAHGYVTFHRHQTTRRDDGGGFTGFGNRFAGNPNVARLLAMARPRGQVFFPIGQDRARSHGSPTAASR